MNYLYKRDKADSDAGTAITRHYLEANVLFFLTAGLTIAFLYNWFSLLSHGNDYLYGNAPAWNIWNVIDIVLAHNLWRNRLPSLARGVAIQRLNTKQQVFIE